VDWNCPRFVSARGRLETGGEIEEQRLYGPHVTQHLFVGLGQQFVGEQTVRLGRRTQRDLERREPDPRFGVIQELFVDRETGQFGVVEVSVWRASIATGLS